LPALARPLSRRFKPLSSGDPVSPGVARHRSSISKPQVMVSALQLVFAGGIYIPPKILTRDEPSPR
jgi:hypothetical protein